ncbi:hypothetical protein SBV1_620039 [Verrucomicrobia bacterium]|nr:hypothetical protein SBV1_620039 [Verrucomicrobiota bacterium]
MRVTLDVRPHNIGRPPGEIRVNAIMPGVVLPRRGDRFEDRRYVCARHALSKRSLTESKGILSLALPISRKD